MQSWGLHLFKCMSAICREKNNNRRLPRCQTGRLPAATGQSEVLCMTTLGIHRQPQFCGKTCPWFDAIVNFPTQVFPSLPSQVPPEGVPHLTLVCPSETIFPQHWDTLALRIMQAQGTISFILSSSFSHALESLLKYQYSNSIIESLRIQDHLVLTK